MIFAVIAQLKFVATYFVPSFYPAMITFLGSALGLFISQYAAPVRGSIEPWLLNLFAVIGVVTLLSTLALTLKKLFGRQPSINEILSGLVSTKTLAEFKEEQRLRCVGLEQQISAARHSFDEASKTELVRVERRFEEVLSLIGSNARQAQELIKTVSRLEERTETHIRNLDNFDAQIRTLIRDLGQITGKGR